MKLREPVHHPPFWPSNALSVARGLLLGWSTRGSNPGRIDVVDLNDLAFCKGMGHVHIHTHTNANTHTHTHTHTHKHTLKHTRLSFRDVLITWWLGADGWVSMVTCLLFVQILIAINTTEG